ncbi:DUF2634 domain-containing protein [Clostridium sp. CF012]|uniref:DUF2634 domain-containing protein n=1 Tax=Clostridium sp. CF012 TaxID=2843319 RepID=UPI001C0BC534|nr:DUF2634 domain-containing protein [Clostridium sp. CF012]MBU3146890.1 DUF2634 domain-containing protein [Clostridium sp. CF012]
MDNIMPVIDIEQDFLIEDYDIVTEQETPTKLGRSFLFNNLTKKFEFAGGRNIEIDEKQAIKQWITLVLRSNKNKINIYKNTDFNCNVEWLIGPKLNSVIESELKREITESLLKNAFIISVDNFILKQIKGTLNVEFNVGLKNSENLIINEVI